MAEHRIWVNPDIALVTNPQLKVYTCEDCSFLTGSLVAAAAHTRLTSHNNPTDWGEVVTRSVVATVAMAMTIVITAKVFDGPAWAGFGFGYVIFSVIWNTRRPR